MYTQPQPNPWLCASLHACDELYHGKIIGMLALDLKKAFDTVNHAILLDKLKHYGITQINLHWFKNYLANRKQIASINGNYQNPLK